MHALITVRTSSSRLPNKCFLLIGGIPVLDFVCQRVTNAGFTAVICTSTDSTDDLIQDFAQSNNILFFRGPLENKIERWSMCAEDLGITDFIVVDADDPYFDPEECKQSLKVLREKKFDALFTSIQSDSGEASVGSAFKTEFMSILSARTKGLQSQNLDVIPWELLLHDEDKVEIKPNKDVNWPGSPRYRLTLDYPEDLQLFDLLAAQFGPTTPREVLEAFLLENPEVVGINAFRSSDFLGNKKTQIANEFGIRK